MRECDTPPKRGSEEYKKIVEHGCGCYSLETDCGTEYDCEFNYPWICEECPCLEEKMKNDENCEIEYL